jgi:hypothetical protein
MTRSRPAQSDLSRDPEGTLTLYLLSVGHQQQRSHAARAARAPPLAELIPEANRGFLVKNLFLDGGLLSPTS